MKELADIILPENYRYTDEQVWIKAIDGVYHVGISDFAQDQLGEVVYVDLPSVGDTFKAADAFGEVESVKAVNKLYMPVNGEVIAINEALEDNPALVNVSCYEQAWMIQIKLEQEADVQALMDASAYRKFLGN